MKKCAAPGCAIDTPTHILMCETHWFMVPRPLRFAVTRAWQAWLNAQPGESHARYQEYLAVRQQAVDALLIGDEVSA